MKIQNARLECGLNTPSTTFHSHLLLFLSQLEFVDLNTHQK